MSLQLILLLALTSRAAGLSIPLEVPQPPTIVSHTPSPVIAFPYDASVSIRCEATGNPPPQYKWTKDGQDFNLPPHMTNTTGTFVVYKKQFAQFQGKYRCFASNTMGTAITEEIELIVASVPKFPKEAITSIVVNEGDPITLECNPPGGLPPRQIHWMSVDLQHIEQDERVSTGLDGNLYFANALEKDSRQDYSCVAAFPRIRTIAQKIPMTVEVKSFAEPPVRIPSLLLPSGVQTEVVLLKGQELQLECLPAGLPTPQIEWMKMGDSLAERALFPKFGKTLIISDIEERDEGKYMCTAKNPAGEAVHYFDVIVEEPPKWLAEPPRSQLTVIGTDVHIKCSVSGQPPPVITWRRNGQIFRDDPARRKRVLDDTVVLHNASPEDSGVYQCEASNQHGSILANVNIMVMNMSPLILTRNHQYAVVEGGDIILNCRVFGSPSPDVYWVRNETLQIMEGERYVLHENKSLQIFRAEKDDSGQYVCVASNSEGRSRLTAVLDVKDRTEISIPPQDTQIVSGMLAQLMCRAKYDKSLQDTFEVAWMKDGDQIPLSSEETSKYYVRKDMLEIMNVGSSDQGLYTCIVRTSLDEAKATALLTVLDVPDAPTNLKLLELESPNKVRLSWIPGSDHNSSITEFVVEYEESQWEPGRWKQLQKVPGNQATAELELHGNLNYQFRVYAVNTIGPGPLSGPTETYSTPAAAPDRNPGNIQIRGLLPHQMDISWEPLPGIEHNGPGMEYEVSYRPLGVDEAWTKGLVRRHLFVVRNTSTFVPYEVKVQSRNGVGWGPEPKVVTGYSGEDVPTAAPQDVAVEVINTTVLRVSWTPVPPATVRGHLGGYNVHWVRKRSLLNLNRSLDERHSLSFPGNRSHAFVPGLQPFSEYRLTVNVFNKKGKGPNGDPVTFNTPEGVPNQVPILTASNAHKDSIVLVWAPPLETNGILTGYLLQVHLINETTLEVVDSQEMNITGADTTQWQLQGLEERSFYRFDLSACTRVGCGAPRAQEGHTAAPTDHNCSQSFSDSIRGNSTHLPLVPALFNISSDVSDTFAKISWTAREEQQDLRLYVAYMNNRDGNWRISEAVNTSQSFHIIDGLKPGTVYTVRLLAKRQLDNSSIFEGVFQTPLKGVASSQRNLSSQGWFIGTMCAVALITLVALIACFVRRNKGGKYAVKEKEDLHPDVESPGMNDDTFCEYSDSEEKPLKGSSSCSLTGNDAMGDSVSRDSLVDYADGGGEFNEDGSFIGEYSGPKHRGSVSEPSGPGPVTA